MPTKPKVITKAQIMHVLTVFVITPVAGYVVAWTAKHFPGMPEFSRAELEVIFSVGAAAGVTTGIHYLHGWQLWERTIGRVIDVEDSATPATPPASSTGQKDSDTITGV